MKPVRLHAISPTFVKAGEEVTLSITGQGLSKLTKKEKFGLLNFPQLRLLDAKIQSDKYMEVKYFIESDAANTSFVFNSDGGNFVHFKVI